jgi:2-keto-4-pentenoate hydratase
MKQASSALAADVIWRNWQEGTAFAALPGDCRPVTRTDGYEIQAHLIAKSPNRPIGWKIAATSKAGQSHIGVTGPLAGRLLAERCYPSGTTLSLAGNRMRVAEPEFAFRCGKRLTPRSAGYSVDEVLAAMDALLPAIEIPNSRFEDYATAGDAQLVADVACAHDFVMGSPTIADWRAIDLASHPVKGTIAGRLARDGVGSNVLDDPRLALTWIVNELSVLGLVLDAGEVITTGTCMTPMAIEPGDHIAADFGVLGRVEVKFS